MRSRSTKCAQLACLACLFATGTVSAANDEHWLDVEGQIQYGYYTEDLRALDNLAARLDAKTGAEPLQGYYAALAYYRLALIAEARDRLHAASAVERCIASLDQSLKLRADWAEALALQGACLGLLAELKALRAPLAGSHSRAQLAHALELEPHNPRVLLLDGWLDFERPHSGVNARACGLFAAAVIAFEAARPGAEHVPEWGPAEGYAYRARCDLERGDVAAARDALERALLIAPDFQLARRLMTRITAG
jgi:tetratricopeptide (TPR) repeat protein